MENSTRIKLDLVLIVLLLAILIALILNLKVIKSEGGICQASPLVYGANQLSEVNGMDLMCSCNFITENALSPTLRFDKYNLSFEVADVPITHILRNIPVIQEGNLKFVE